MDAGLSSAYASSAGRRVTIRPAILKYFMSKLNILWLFW